MKLISAHRDPGVHAITVECDCGVTFIWHSDSDVVICQNCKRRGRWRDGQWSKLNPTLASKAPLIEAAQQEEEQDAVSEGVGSEADGEAHGPVGR